MANATDCDWHYGLSCDAEIFGLGVAACSSYGFCTLILLISNYLRTGFQKKRFFRNQKLKGDLLLNVLWILSALLGLGYWLTTLLTDFSLNIAIFAEIFFLFTAIPYVGFLAILVYVRQVARALVSNIQKYHPKTYLIPSTRFLDHTFWSFVGIITSTNICVGIILGYAKMTGNTKMWSLTYQIGYNILGVLYLLLVIIFWLVYKNFANWLGKNIKLLGKYLEDLERVENICFNNNYTHLVSEFVKLSSLMLMMILSALFLSLEFFCFASQYYLINNQVFVRFLAAWSMIYPPCLVTIASFRIIRETLKIKNLTPANSESANEYTFNSA